MNFRAAENWFVENTKHRLGEFQPGGKSGHATQNVPEGEIAAFQESAICLRPTAQRLYFFYVERLRWSWGLMSFVCGS